MWMLGTGVFLVWLVCLKLVPGLAQDNAVEQGAQLFSHKCVLCHTIGQGALIGPDLKGQVARNASDVEAAVVRMQKNVGILQREDIKSLVQFLQKSNAAEILTKATSSTTTTQGAGPGVAGKVTGFSALISPMLRPQSAPASVGSAPVGQMLFCGKRRLVNGGIACLSCHSAGVAGGNMGPDLTDVANRLSAQNLLDILRTVPFAVMKATYANHPIARQEALDLVQYLQSLKKQQSNDDSTARRS